MEIRIDVGKRFSALMINFRKLNRIAPCLLKSRLICGAQYAGRYFVARVRRLPVPKRFHLAISHIYAACRA